MFLAASNKSKRLLHVSYVGQVGPEEIKAGLEDLKMLLADLPPDFRLLVDLGRLESMDLACAPELGRAMEMIDQHGVGLVVRMIPDPSKDIGLNIFTIFHYARRPKIVTCQNILEAARALSL
jgi:anti-anti-sigma regulatory factor